jgi:hypothetical protein
MRYDLKGVDGGIRTKVHHGPELEDPVRITQRVDDDQVVELEFDLVELRGLHHVLGAIVKVRAEAAAKAAAAGAKVAVALAFVFLLVVAGPACLEAGDGSTAPWVVTYAERSAGAYFDATGDGGATVRSRCGLPPPEQLELGPPRPGCTYVPRDRDVGLNLLCGQGTGHVTFEWEPHAEGGRGDLRLERPDCRGDYAVELHRDRGAE